MKDVNKTTIIKKIKDNILKSTIWIVILAICVPFGILGLIYFFDAIGCVGAYTRLEDGINVWFTFWGSYAGAVTTLILSMATIGLSIKLDKDNKRHTLLQQAMEFHKFQVESIKLYRMEDIFQEKELEKLFSPFYKMIDVQQIGRIHNIFVIEFQETFPPYFDFEIKKIMWRSGDKTENELNRILGR